MANITYANKDKNATEGSAERQWRDVDANEVKTVVNGKEDKVSGKGLSQNDYTNADKGKVDALPKVAILSLRAPGGGALDVITNVEIAGINFTGSEALAGSYIINADNPIFDAEKTICVLMPQNSSTYHISPNFQVASAQRLNFQFFDETGTLQPIPNYTLLKIEVYP